MDSFTKKIAEELDSVKINFEQAKQGDLTLFLQKENKNKYVLSKYAPRANAKVLLEQQERNEGRPLWIIIGFGMGYILDELFEEQEDLASIIVIEPNPQILKEQLTIEFNKKWEFLGQESFFSGTEFEKLEQLFEEKATNENINNVILIIHPGYEEFYHEYCKMVINVLSQKRNELLVNYNTINQRAIHLAENVIKNGKLLANSYDIKSLKDQYKGTAALIVSAGPSLSKNIEYIKDFNGIIFSGGRTIEAIEAHGKQPDFVAVVDTEENVYHTFGNRIDNGYPLIATLGAYHKVAQCAKGPRYFISNSNNQTGADFYQIPLEQFELGGTVASLCVEAAHYMGCNPIIFIGQDLAYTDMKSHAGAKENSIESIQESTRGGAWIDAYYGGKILSDASLIGFLRWFEQYISSHPDRSYINATEGGAAIRGMEQKTFREVVESYNGSKQLDIAHQEILLSEGHVVQVLKNRKNELEAILTCVEKGIQIIGKLKQEYESKNQLNEQNVERLLRNLEVEVDSKLRSGQENKLFDLVKEVYYFRLFDEYKVQEAMRGREIGQIYKRERLYKSMKLASQELIRYIKMEET